MIKKRIKLTKEEQAIEDSLEEILQGPSLDLGLLQEAAKNTASKSKHISLRLSEVDYRQAQVRALEEGMPYQTLLASVIHLFLTGRLVRDNNSSR